MERKKKRLSSAGFVVANTAVFSPCGDRLGHPSRSRLSGSDEGGEASDGGPGAGGQTAGGPVEGAVLAGGVGALQGRGGSPAALGPEQAALALGLRLDLGLGAGGAELGGQRGQGGQGRWGAVLWVARLRLGVAVGLCPGDALLLAAPRVVVGGVADVVVDKGVGLLAVGVHLVLTVAALRVRHLGGLLGQTAALGRDEVVVLGAHILVGVVQAAGARSGGGPGVNPVLAAEGVFDGQPAVVELQGGEASLVQADHLSVAEGVTVGVVS